MLSVYLRRHRKLVFTLLLGLALSATTASAEEQERPFSGPPPLRNDHPVYLTLFSIAMPDRARTVAPGRWMWEIGYVDSNTIIDQHNVNESDRLIVDGEIQRIELDVKYGLGPQWELEAAIPYMILGGGYLDDFIQSFEDTFGFVTPGARESRGKDEFRYLFRVNGNNLIDEVDEVIHGLGDIPIRLKYQIRDGSEGFLPRLAARGILKLPTATDSLLGNGRVDGGVGLLAEQPLPWRILVFSNLDVTSTHLPRKLRTLDIDPVMVSGSFGFEHFLTNRLSWQTQLTMATNPLPKFHPDMRTLNRLPMGVALGGAYRFSKTIGVRLMVTENINSSWSDFSWGISFRKET